MLGKASNKKVKIGLLAQVRGAGGLREVQGRPCHQVFLLLKNDLIASNNEQKHQKIKILCPTPTLRNSTRTFKKFDNCHTRLHLGFSAKLRIWQVQFATKKNF